VKWNKNISTENRKEFIIMISFFILILGFDLASPFSSCRLRLDSSRELAMNLIGAPSKREGGFFDPLKLLPSQSEDKMRWFRSAELKHGRVCMLAATGIILQGPLRGLIPNPAFTEDSAFGALKKVYTENPMGLLQIGIAIAAIEVVSSSIEEDAERPGDYGFDPFGIRPKNPEALDIMQVKELKNGRLAMLATAGLLYVESITGQSVGEQWALDHILPFGDGQGFF
jgi:hypothetical protein